MCDQGCAHGRQIYHRGHAGKVLHQYPAGMIGDFLVRAGSGAGGQRRDIFTCTVDPIFVAQQVFQQNLTADWQAAGAWMCSQLTAIDGKIAVGFAIHF